MLSHLKVLELADGLGAYTGRILAELGACVIKIEPPGGEASRRHGQISQGADASLEWLAWNVGKQGARLDPHNRGHRPVLLRLLAEADILVQGTADQLAAVGIGEAALAAINPRLIAVVVAPYGERGPLAGDPATDLTLMAMSGIMNIVGEPVAPPLKLPGAQAHALAGIQGAIAALMALHDRAATGLGQRVVVSAYQSAVLAGYRDPIVWEWTGQLGKRTGNRLVRGKSGVRQVWQCQDGYITWSLVDNPGLIRGLVGFMSRDGQAGSLAAVNWETTLLADAPQEQINAWEAEIEAYFLRFTTQELARMNTEAPMGLSVIETPAMALENPQWAARDFWRTLHDPARGLDLTLPGPLFCAGEPGHPHLCPAPRLDSANVTSFVSE